MQVHRAGERGLLCVSTWKSWREASNIHLRSYPFCTSPSHPMTHTSAFSFFPSSLSLPLPSLTHTSGLSSFLPLFSHHTHQPFSPTALLLSPSHVHASPIHTSAPWPLALFFPPSRLHFSLPLCKLSPFLAMQPRPRLVSSCSIFTTVILGAREVL